MSASTQAGMFFPPAAPDAAVCSTDAEKEEEEKEEGTQAQTAAEESSMKVPPVLINLCDNTNNTLGCSQYSTSVPPLSSWFQVPKRIEVHSIHTYVALYRFLPQEHNDLELQ